MALFYDPQETDEFHDQALGHLASTFAHPLMRSEFLNDADPQSYHLSRPHRTYEYSGEKGVGEGWLNSARFSGWRFLGLGPSEEHPSFSIVFSADKQKRAVSRGPLVQRTLDVMRGIDELQFPADTDHEMRLLQIPDLLAGFVWFAKEGDDYLIPIMGRGALFDQMLPRRPDELRGELQELLLASLERA